MATITIIGTGLIGSSAGLVLQNQGNFIIGYDNSKKNLQQALSMGAINKESNDLKEICRQSAAVFLCVPVEEIKKSLGKILSTVSKNCVVIDMGSTKTSICRQVRNHPNRSAYVAAHPLAGSEQSGPAFAKETLFAGKTIVVCEKELSSQNSIKTALNLFHEMGLHTIFMTPEKHDSMLAITSHLPQVLSYALAGIPEFRYQENMGWEKLTGGGFETTTRLALSSSEVWMPILMDNKKALIGNIQSLSNTLLLFAEKLASNDFAAVSDLIQTANKVRKTLDKQNKRIKPLNN